MSTTTQSDSFITPFDLMLDSDGNATADFSSWMSTNSHTDLDATVLGLSDGTIDATEFMVQLISEVLSANNSNFGHPIDLCGKTWLISHIMVLKWGVKYTTSAYGTSGWEASVSYSPVTTGTSGETLTLRNGHLLVRPNTNHTSSATLGASSYPIALNFNTDNRYRVNIENVAMEEEDQGTSVIGMYIKKATQVYLQNLSFRHLAAGIYFANLTQVVEWYGGSVSDNLWGAATYGVAGTNPCTDIKFYGVEFSENVNSALYLVGARGFSFEGCVFSGLDATGKKGSSTGPLVHMDEGCNFTSFVGCEFSNLGYGSTANAIRVQPTNNGEFRAFGCVFGEAQVLTGGNYPPIIYSAASTTSGPGCALVANTFPILQEGVGESSDNGTGVSSDQLNVYADTSAAPYRAIMNVNLADSYS